MAGGIRNKQEHGEQTFLDSGYTVWRRITIDTNFKSVNEAVKVGKRSEVKKEV